ncbi:hypothetical protein [Larkinella punicea]|jgi:hypothetical protein|uniref:Uncharacterized protein n=1 Tax=Larkinella punicea TaxID=2315727 RepID=A0A368JHR8_9BACT|nr:hypothetical protein [Larkinella punicea]RCR67092.1 hypothetical protein DUE52_23855 [Larkinella punicea]
MEPQISREELEGIEKLIVKVNHGELQQQVQKGHYSQADSDSVLSAIRKLLEFGEKHIKTRASDYKLYRTNGESNPMLLLGLAINNPQMIQELVSQYRLAERNAAKEKFFSMKVADMTGADLAQFLQLVGK